MNKHGQALVTFVLILPLILLFVAFLIDSGLIVMEKARMNGILKSNLEAIVQEEEINIVKLEQIVKRNDQDINLDIQIKGNVLIVEASKKNKSLFGKILKMKWQDVKTTYCVENKEIKKNCEVG